MANSRDKHKNELAYADAVEALAGKPYLLGANGPHAYDCSSAVCHGIRTVIGDFGDYTAHSLRKHFTKRLANRRALRRGTLIFYDYTADGNIDHVTTVLNDHTMLHPSSGRGELMIVSLTYLDTYTYKRSGKIYYAEIDWRAAQNSEA